MRPGTTDWTCPECGHENGERAMGEFGPEDAGASARAASAGTRRTARAGRGRPGRARGPATRAQLATIAVVGIAAVLAIAFALSSLGGETTGTATASPDPVLTSTQALCLHLRDLQTPREEAYTRLAATLQTDAATITSRGGHGPRRRGADDARGGRRLSGCPCGARGYEQQRRRSPSARRDAVLISARLALCARECQLSSRHGRPPGAVDAQGDRAARGRRGVRGDGRAGRVRDDRRTGESRRFERHDPQRDGGAGGAGLPHAIRTPPPAGSRPTPATGTTSTPCPRRPG